MTNAFKEPAAERPRRVWPLAVLIAGMLLVNFALRLPTAQVADWGQFAFYDPGTVLKGDMLLSKGYVPTVDFGYTHGLLSLLYGRIGFAILGRSAAAFLVLTLAAEMVMAWAMGRILVAAGVSGWGIVIFVMALPTAIMPAYLTLTHPLEAMFILLALASQAEGRRGGALALMAACVFVKPSMGYVYGLILVVMILWEGRGNFRRVWRELMPAAVVVIVTFGGLGVWMGVGPVVRTLLPTTGAATYAATGFGFFARSGREFWWPAHPWDDFFTAAGVFLVAAVAGVMGVVWAVRKWRVGVRGEMIFTMGVLHTAFLVGFYGWSGSWSYYSYLPMLGLSLLVTILPLRQVARVGVVMVLAGLFLSSYDQVAGDIYNGWRYKIRNRDTGYLWADADLVREWGELGAVLGGDHALIMTNGCPDPSSLRGVPLELPDAWFPEPGIPTRSEIARVKKQAEGARWVILWWEYRGFDLWNSAKFAGTREEFGEVFRNERFRVLRRVLGR